MELLTSKKFKLPTLYFITDRSRIKELPLGIPFIVGDEKIKPYIITLLEYEVIYQKALQTGLPFNFKLLLEEAGFDTTKTFEWCVTTKLEYTGEENFEENFNISENLVESANFKEFVKDCTAYVDIQKLKDLNVFPIWFVENIEKAIHTNIHNFAVFNNNMYNKKLEGMYGGLELITPDRNLLNIDISASIPKAVGTSTMLLSKWMAETFYCDLIITGKDTIFIPYEELYSINIEDLYNKYGNSQECKVYRKLITSTIKHYKTCIIFGDYNSVCDKWNGEKEIKAEKGKKLNKWTIDKLISFHTTSNDDIAAFADWFSPIEIEIVKDWVKYLNKEE